MAVVGQAAQLAQAVVPEYQALWKAAPPDPCLLLAVNPHKGFKSDTELAQFVELARQYLKLS